MFSNDTKSILETLNILIDNSEDGWHIEELEKYKQETITHIVKNLRSPDLHDFS